MNRADGKPFVSVIVPTRARAGYIGRLLRSLLAQDWPRQSCEIIVVHNFTDDGTDRIVADVAADALVPITYYRTGFSGPGSSRQFAAERARGSVLAFIDDDCEAAPGWIAAGVERLADGFAVVQGRTLPQPEQPRRLLEKTISVTGPTPFFETCNIFYDAEVFRAVGGFPTGFRERFGGDDPALGWTVRRAGYPTGFAENALVYHEVFSVSLRDWLLEPRKLRHWPFLARAFPEIRRELFLGLFMSRLTAAFDLFVLGVIGGVLLHPACAVLVVPYVVLRFCDRGRFRAPHILFARLICGLPRACILAGTLLVGSVQARALVI
jgi:glycosyltransferase involved in cell wall biosynthesis